MDRELLANFIFEISTLRKTARSHRQTLLTDDLSDNISSHSNQVTVIGIFLAEIEGAKIERVVCMCASHDWPETRSGDRNWIHKIYTEIDTERIIADQFLLHQSKFMQGIIAEYEERKTLESTIAKDADTIAQAVLLKEYAMQGNKEAQAWLEGKSRKRPYAWADRCKLDSAKELCKAIYDVNPSDWWNNSYANKL